MDATSWLIDNQQKATFFGTVVGTTILSSILLPHLTCKAILIISTGALLSIGFHFGRKICTAYDVASCKWDKDLAKEIGQELGV